MRGSYGKLHALSSFVRFGHSLLAVIPMLWGNRSSPPELLAPSFNGWVPFTVPDRHR